MKKICRPNKKHAERFRRKWYDFYGYRCAYCTADCSENPTIDHLIPLSKGGGNTLDNLVIACYTCNFRKGNKLLKNFKPLLLKPLKQGVQNETINTDNASNICIL
jgi:5-methylcytosine-specific restriction endonuclease McrA